MLPAGTDYYSLYEQLNAASLGEIIDIALSRIEDANIEMLQGVFRNISFNSEAALGQTKQRNTRLKNLLSDFADPRLDMHPSRINGLDVIGNAYEYLSSPPGQARRPAGNSVRGSSAWMACQMARSFPARVESQASSDLLEKCVPVDLIHGKAFSWT